MFSSYKTITKHWHGHSRNITVEYHSFQLVSHWTIAWDNSLGHWGVVIDCWIVCLLWMSDCHCLVVCFVSLCSGRWNKVKCVVLVTLCRSLVMPARCCSLRGLFRPETPVLSLFWTWSSKLNADGCFCFLYSMFIRTENHKPWIYCEKCTNITCNQFQMSCKHACDFDASKSWLHHFQHHSDELKTTNSYLFHQKLNACDYSSIKLHISKSCIIIYFNEEYTFMYWPTQLLPTLGWKTFI